ncbi:mitogen-activated protein kinase kinase kinase 17 [Euphorbia peplus]|nr:mitogen-activated protein kinase kinase kinase 17 [Euphorbia peplus]
MNSWTRGCILGHGSTASVSLATSLSSGEVFAVKSAELSQSEFLQREQRIHSSIAASPHIVGYKGCDITKENNKVMYNLFLEYMSGGTLTDYVQARGGRIDESVIGFYTCQIVEALDYLHSNGIVHCDIKGRNILVGENGAKIADFGCAKRITDSATIGGTPMFMAPEVARGEEQGCASDIWAMGCTIIEMATGGTPWLRSCNDDAVCMLYQIGFSDKLPELPKHLSEDAKDFMDKCLRRNPRERWTAKQLLNHSFLGKYRTQNSIWHSYSPTSILEHGFWNSVDDESDNLVNSTTSTSTSTTTTTTTTSSGASERIKGLIGSSSGGARWDWDGDENWINVRCDSNAKMISNIGLVNELVDRISTCKYGKNSFLLKDDLLFPCYYTSPPPTTLLINLQS